MSHRDISPGVPWPQGYPAFSKMDVNNSGSVNSTDIEIVNRYAGSCHMITSGGPALGIVSNTVFYSEDAGETREYLPDIRIRTSPSSGSSSTNWIRIARISLDGQSQAASLKIDVTGSSDSGGSGYSATIYLATKQQAALGNDPVGKVYISNCVGLSATTVKAIITDVTSSESTIDLYVQAVRTYMVFNTRVINEVKRDNPGIYYSMGDWETDLPDGTQLTTTVI